MGSGEPGIYPRRRRIFRDGCGELGGGAPVGASGGILPCRSPGRGAVGGAAFVETAFAHRALRHGGARPQRTHIPAARCSSTCRRLRSRSRARARSGSRRGLPSARRGRRERGSHGCACLRTASKRCGPSREGACGIRGHSPRAIRSEVLRAVRVRSRCFRTSGPA